MPANFQVVKFAHHADGVVTVTKDKSKISSDIFKLPELAGSGTESPSPSDPQGVILMFMLSGKDGSVLKMANDKTPTTTPASAEDVFTFTLPLDHTYTNPQLRFEVLDTRLFAASGNKLTITLVNPEDGQHITVSDVKIFYHD